MGTKTYFDINKVMVELVASNDPILVRVNHDELLNQLPPHVVLKAGLHNALINSSVLVGQPITHVLFTSMGWRDYHIIVRHFYR